MVWEFEIAAAISDAQLKLSTKLRTQTYLSERNKTILILFKSYNSHHLQARERSNVKQNDHLVTVPNADSKSNAYICIYFVCICIYYSDFAPLFVEDIRIAFSLN